MVAEIVDGELFTSPRPATPHARASMLLGADLIGGFDESTRRRDAPGGWWFLVEPELHFGGDVLVPDLAGWRRERLPTIPNVAALTLHPTGSARCSRRATARLDRARKMHVYAREGCRAPLAARSDRPRARELSSRWKHWVVAATYDGDATIRAEPFDASTPSPCTLVARGRLLKEADLQSLLGRSLVRRKLRYASAFAPSRLSISTLFEQPAGLPRAQVGRQLRSATSFTSCEQSEIVGWSEATRSTRARGTASGCSKG